ncbi:galactosylgalactosylxylosylprotein 3-beta-glucuronosyltransferase [Elysia marginata]|uniref:Galactosylgalactosylxylosylprotein 3-beta-glucuronosyltransferase n=1 Tax=Elysia marginata TaxID=1093978 RepID=A0AAV4FS64_9GAST|nr:galactosylgalactosylxylosylprotein 3-beta-glucuronosyltransferase [Elysia marginata]
MARILPKFLYFCVIIFTFLSALMIIDSLRECSDEELSATRELLKKYADQLQDLKKERKILLEEIQSQSQKQIGPLRGDNARVSHLPTIYIITPTAFRAEQKADLTRLSHTLKLVNNIHWIVIEDSESKTTMLSRLLEKSGLNYTHLNVLTPSEYKMASKDPNWLKPRGVLQRNAGLDWLRNHEHSLAEKAVLYFADDDNTYSLDIFEEMRYTQKAAVWPVGLVGYLRYERPVVKKGKVVGWFTAWRPDRPFAMDMAGFAVNVQLVLKFPQARFSNQVQRGYQESTFLSGLQLTLADLEPRAKMCTQVIEKSNEYNLPLCVGFIDYEKAFDSVEHFAIFDALRQININEKYVNILENIYQNATARVHIDNIESELFPIKRGVRQGDPISTKLFTAAIEMIFRKAELKHGLNVEGETLTNLRFADDVALVTENTKSMEEQLNNLNKISLESGLKMHKGKTKYMINFESHENIPIDKEKIEEVPNYKYLGQTTYLKETTKEEVTCRIRAGWSCFGKYREIFLDDKMPISLKRQVHEARLQDNRWTLRVTEWQPRNGKRSRRRQARRWRDGIVRTMGNTWTREAKDREEWRCGAEGFILQWMDGA